MAITIPPDELLGLYASGWFPMTGVDGVMRIYSPDPRAILPLEKFHIPRGARRAIADPAWEVRLDTAFDEVVRLCAARSQTWIDDRIAASYSALHSAGHAHSVEIWQDGLLAGGLYGVRIGGAFFGESMFHRVTGASKAALARLVQILRVGNFQLLDIQWITPHLATFGAEEIPRKDYLRLLNRAMDSDAHWPEKPCIA